MKSGTQLRHGSLFSGIGGFDFAAGQMGWENIFHCETNPFCRTVLSYYYPKAESNDDIKKTDFKKYKGRIDILTGGFPCQPYSTAGKRLGKADPRHLWPEMLRAVREIQPRWVLGENVRGLISWNGGLVFHEMQSDLETEGYSVLPFLLPAAGVNAPHRRERIWFIAYRSGIGRNEEWRSAQGEEKGPPFRTDVFTQSERLSEERSTTDANNGKQQEQQECGTEDRQCTSESWGGTGLVSGSGNSHGNVAERIRQLATGAGFLQDFITDTNSTGFQKTGTKQPAAGFEQYRELVTPDTSRSHQNKRQQLANRYKKTKTPASRCWPQCNWRAWESFPTQSALCHGDDGISSRLDGIAFSKWRSESIKAGGNAIVPQVAIMMFKIIQIISNEQKTDQL
jgi:DNA (cytosine-5)-methyltransferase 1